MKIQLLPNCIKLFKNFQHQFQFKLLSKFIKSNQRLENNVQNIFIQGILKIQLSIFRLILTNFAGFFVRNYLVKNIENVKI